MTKSLLDDDLNRRIIACLQQEGRMSHAELAERFEGFSVATNNWFSPKPPFCVYLASAFHPSASILSHTPFK